MSIEINSPFLTALERHNNRIAKLTSGLIDNPMGKIMKEQQDIFTKMFSGISGISSFTALQEQHSSIAKLTSGLIDNPMGKIMREQQDSFTKISSIFSSQTIQSILDDVEISESKKEITKKEENIIDEILQDVTEVSPDIGILIKSFELQNYKKIAIFMIIWFIYNILPMYQLYNDILNSDTHYKINRNNVRVRLSPNIDNNKDIITKLNKNTYIEKLGSKNGWTKVRFELDDGIEKEGWVYRTMLTKMD